jgi:Putative lactococcus lactis phage r1t holin
MWTVEFWKDAAERAVRTAAQVMATMMIAAGTGLLDTDWIGSLSAAGMATVLSVLTSIAGDARTKDGTAALMYRTPSERSATYAAENVVAAVSGRSVSQPGATMGR